MSKTLTLTQTELDTLTNILDQAADYRREWREQYTDGGDIHMPPLEEDEAYLYGPLEGRLRSLWLDHIQPEPKEQSAEPKEQSAEPVDELTQNTVLCGLRVLGHHMLGRLGRQSEEDMIFEAYGMEILTPSQIHELADSIRSSSVGLATFDKPKPRMVSQVATIACTVVTPEHEADHPPTNVLRTAFEERMNDLDSSGDLEWYEAVDLDDAVYEDTHQPFTGFKETR